MCLNLSTLAYKFKRNKLVENPNKNSIAFEELFKVFNLGKTLDALSYVPFVSIANHAEKMSLIEAMTLTAEHRISFGQKI